MPFEQQIKDEIVELFKECGGVTEKTTRVALVKRLGPAACHIDEHENAHDHIVAILQVCIDRDCLEALADACLNCFGRSQPVYEAIWAIRDASGKSFITRPECNAILDIIPQSLNGDLLRQALTRAIPTLPVLDVYNVYDALFSLSMLPINNNSLVIFMREIAGGITPTSRKTEISDWIKNFCRSRGLPDQSGYDGESVDRLLVCIKPALEGRDLYDCLFITTPAASAPPRPAGSRARDLAELKIDIEQAVDKYLEVIGGAVTESFTIEFVVPEELVGEAWDELMIHTGFNQVPLGSNYLVIVRHSGRDSSYRKAAKTLRDRWTAMHELTLDQSLEWVEHAPSRALEYDADTLYNKLRASPDRAIVGFGYFPLHTPARGSYIPHLRAALAEGVPVLVWAREPLDMGTVLLSAEIRELLVSGHASTIPRALQTVRELARRGSNIWAEHLTLIWDDPERPLPLLSVPA